MIILTMVCDRCGKETVEDLSNTSFHVDDQARKANFHYINANKRNMMICNGCFNQFEELKGMQEEKAFKEACEFFQTCGKEEDGDNGETENG